MGRVDAGERLVQPYRRECVSTGDDKEIVVAARVDSCSYFFDVLGSIHNLLAKHMAAPLRPLLVLEKASGRAGVDQLAHCPHNIQCAAVPRVGIDDDRYRHRTAAPSGTVDNLGLG